MHRACDAVNDIFLIILGRFIIIFAVEILNNFYYEKVYIFIVGAYRCGRNNVVREGAVA